MNALIWYPNFENRNERREQYFCKQRKSLKKIERLQVNCDYKSIVIEESRALVIMDADHYKEISENKLNGTSFYTGISKLLGNWTMQRNK